MKKIYTVLAAAFIAVSAFAQQSANTGLYQFSSWQPSPGEISLDVNEQGVASILFNLRDAASKPNRDADKFATLSRDGEVLSVVPVSNTFQLKYDNILADIWQLLFYTGRQSITTQAGNYEVRIDEGFFLIGQDETPSAEVVANYFIPAPEMTVTPPQDASGKTYQYSSLQNWTIEFGGVKSMKLVEGKNLEIIDMFGHGGSNLAPLADDDENSEGEFTPTDGLHPQLVIDGNKLLVMLDTPITKPGTWKIEAQAGLLELEYEDGSKKLSADMHLFYFVPNFSLGKPEIYPIPGEVDYIPGVLTLEVNRAHKIKNVNSMAVSYLYPIDENGNRGTYVARFIASKSKTSDYQVILTNWNGADQDLLLAPGKYELQTGEKLYSVENGNEVSYISSMVFEYEVLAFDVFEKSLDPAPGSYSSIKSIAVTFKDIENLEVSWTSAPSTLKSTTTTYAFNPKKSESDPFTAVFELPVAATMPGIYEFKTATGALHADDMAVVVTGTYTIGETGVKAVSELTVMPERFDIYDAQGIVIARNADMDVLKSLPAGLYIAAGKKFINR